MPAHLEILAVILCNIGFMHHEHATVAEPGVMTHFSLLHDWWKNRVIKLGSKPKSTRRMPE
jgi:hypothetical protein